MISFRLHPEIVSNDFTHLFKLLLPLFSVLIEEKKKKKSIINLRKKERIIFEPTFRYDLNQIPYDYTMEVRNRFKGLDLIDRV